MGHIINYVKEIHDVYTYDSVPILNWFGNTFSWAKPIAFNTNIYLKNITDYVPGSTLPTDIDLSGIIARRRGVTVYFDKDIQMPNIGLGYFNGFSDGNAQTYPISNDDLRTWIAEDGWGGYYTNLIDDYNHWNNGEPPGCLISPMHVLVGGHMIDPLFAGRNNDSPYDIKSYTEEELGNTDSPFIKLRFIGKNNQIYEKFAVLSFFLNDAPGGPGLNCVNSGTATGVYEPSYCQNYVDNLNQNFDIDGVGEKDLAILELRSANDLNIPEPLTEEELKHIKIYKIANFNSWPNNAPTFQVTPNGVLLIWRKNVNLTQTNPYYSHLTYPLIPVNGYQLLDGVGGKIPISLSTQFYGDSCNFMYGYYPPTQELVLFGATNTGFCYFQYNELGVPYDIPFLTSLKKWIYERTLTATGTGYNISWIDYSDQNEAIIIENEPYPLYKTISAGITTASYSGVTSGITYAFALTSYNSSGYSGYVGPIYTRIP